MHVRNLQYPLLHWASELAQSSERLRQIPPAVLGLVLLFPAYPNNLSLNSCKQFNSRAFNPNPNSPSIPQQ